jgi:GT2 family glycosyltransferase
MSKVAVQILTWNGKEHLPALFASLRAQTFQDFELYIIDNGSTDGTGLMLEESIRDFPRGARLGLMPKNMGFAGGHDALFAMGQEPYVCCLNQDAVLDASYLEKLVRFLDEHEDAGAVAGKLVRKDAAHLVIDSAGLKRHWTGAVSDIGAGETDRGQYDAATEVFGVSGALPLYRRSAVLKASPDGTLFDESFFAYKEDVDLAWRLRLAGYKAYTVGEATGYHVRSVRPGARRDAWRQRLAVKNHMLMLVKDMPAAEWHRMPAVAAYELIKALYLAVSCPSALAGYADAWRGLPNALKMRKVIQNHG